MERSGLNVQNWPTGRMRTMLLPDLSYLRKISASTGSMRCKQSMNSAPSIRRLKSFNFPIHLCFCTSRRNLLIHGLWTHGDQPGRPVEIRHRPRRNGKHREIVLRYEFLNQFPERINRIETAIVAISNDVRRILRALRMVELGLSDD